MPVGVSHHRKVTYHSTGIYRRLNQNILVARLFDNPIDFCPALALKTEVIETSFHLILNYD